MVAEAVKMFSPEEYVMLKDEAAGLDGVIAIHSTTRGPSAGGCRLWTYDGDQAVLADAFRLSEGMSYKNALAGLPLGGGKAVLRRPPGEFDRRALFRAFGREVQKLAGRYVTAEDVGTSVDDMVAVAQETSHVAGLAQRSGFPGGDPSPWTARGVFVAMRYLVEERLGRRLNECKIAVQGVGHVGESLALMLRAAGAKLIIADTDRRRVVRVAAATGATVMSVDDILSADADILAPCALGAVFHSKSIAYLRVKAICGAANNQLATPEDGDRLADREILYAPDYVVNAGGIINVAAEYLGWSCQQVSARIENTDARLRDVLALADRDYVSPGIAADRLAREVIMTAARSRALAA